MNKEAILGMKASTPLHAYSRYVERYPWLEGLLLSGGLGTAGYYGSGFAADKIMDALTVNMSPEEKAKAKADMERDGTMDIIKKIGAGTGGLLGLAYVLNKHMDLGKGAKGALGSMFDPSYKKDNPDFRKRREQAAKDRIKKSRWKGKEVSYRDYQNQKIGGYDDPFHKENIPISYAEDVINRDPFLSRGQKGATNMLLEGSEGSGSGLTSGRKLMRSALQAGVGFGTAYLFGNTAGKVLSLSPDITRRLSTVGGVAGALVNTGIFKELRTP